MKKNLLPVLLLLIFSHSKAQVGIGTSVPNSSSILDVNVNNLPANGKKGLLMPQVALASLIDVTTIPNPANGLVVYNTTNAGTSPNNVTANSFYKYNTTTTRWELLIDEASLASLKIPTIGSILGFNATGNTTTYLGSDQGATIRQIMFDRVRLQTPVCTFNTTTKEFVANKTGYYNFQVNLVIKGPFSGNARIGVSKPYTGAIPAIGSNAFVAFLAQNTYSVDAAGPMPLAVNGLLLMNAGEKVIFLTRYIDPTVNTLDVESINYDRTLISSVNVTYFSN